MQRTTQPDLEGVLENYGLSDVARLVPGGGTAGRTWKVIHGSGTSFLRLRGERTSTAERLEYDHGLRAHLVRHGIPTVVAKQTKEGRQWMRAGGRVFELYPFVEGRRYDAASITELENAARALAGFHEAARGFRPANNRPLKIAQYAWLGFCAETSDRLDDPRLQAANIRALREVIDTKPERRVADWALERAEQLGRTYAGGEFRRLERTDPAPDRPDGSAGADHWVGHGDYTPANVLYDDDGRIAGIFDFDWAMPSPRCRDVGDALYFFAGARGEVDPSSIWSLTKGAEFDLERTVRFLRAYQSVSPLTAPEWNAIPRAFEARWFSIRLEGMAKVPEADRIRFFARDIEVPVVWLDKNWDAIRHSGLPPG